MDLTVTRAGSLRLSGFPYTLGFHSLTFLFSIDYISDTSQLFSPPARAAEIGAGGSDAHGPRRGEPGVIGKILNHYEITAEIGRGRLIHIWLLNRITLEPVEYHQCDGYFPSFDGLPFCSP
jgi:hypothetical protein